MPSVYNDEHDLTDKIQVLCNEYAQKRKKRYAAASAVIACTLPLFTFFAAESSAKAFFLILWVIVVLACVGFMLHTEYRYHVLCEFLKSKEKPEEKEENHENRL